MIESIETLNLNWFIRNSRELFPGEPDPVLPLREICVDVLDGERILRCAITDCPAYYKMPVLNTPPKSSVQVFLDSQAPHSEVEPSGIADNARYICREHNPKPSQGVFFQPHALEGQLGSTAIRPIIIQTENGPELPQSSLALGPHETLLEMFDREEPFMTDGNRLKKPRDYERIGTTPEWMFNNKKIAALLRLRFPKIATSEQQERAGRWIAVIVFYYRQGMPAGERDKQTGVDAKMNWKPGTTAQIVLKIRRYLQGLKASDGKQITGRRGRPKKIVQLPPNMQVMPDLKVA